VASYKVVISFLKNMNYRGGDKDKMTTEKRRKERAARVSP
jgi:hypothetical protein